MRKSFLNHVRFRWLVIFPVFGRNLTNDSREGKVLENTSLGYQLQLFTLELFRKLNSQKM